MKKTHHVIYSVICYVLIYVKLTLLIEKRFIHVIGSDDLDKLILSFQSDPRLFICYMPIV